MEEFEVYPEEICALHKWNAEMFRKRRERKLKIFCFLSWTQLCIEELEKKRSQIEQQISIQQRRTRTEITSTLSARSNQQLREELAQLKREQGEIESNTARVRSALNDARLSARSSHFSSFYH